MNRCIIQILMGLALFLGLGTTSCGYAGEETYHIFVVNETQNDLCVISDKFCDGVAHWGEDAPIFFIEPHGRCCVEYFLAEEEFEDSWVLKVIFMETVKPKADVNSRADTSNVRTMTKFYTLQELLAMDLTIVYDGSME